MKWLALLLIFISHIVAANTDFNLTEVRVNCVQSDECPFRKIRFENLRGKYRSLVHFKETLKLVASDGGYQDFSYDLYQKDDGVYSATINMRIKPTIKEINIGFTDRNIQADPNQLLNLKEREYFEPAKLKESLEGLSKKLESMGYPHNSHEVKVTEKQDKIFVNLIITLGEPRIFKRIKSNASSSFVHDFLVRKFYFLYDKPFELTKFKLYLDDAQKELFEYGYYLVNLDFVPIIKNNRVVLDIKVTNDRLFAFDFEQLQIESRDSLLVLVKDMFKKYKRPLQEANLKQAIKDHYKKMAILKTDVKVSTSKFKNKFNETVTVYKVVVGEGQKTILKEVSFIGNYFYTTEKLKKKFEKEAFELASINYYDDEYFNYFVGYLKNEYYQQGFVQAKITGPIKQYTENKKEASIEYVIQEGQRAFVRSVTIEGITPEMEDILISKMDNKIGAPFNPIIVMDDLKKVTNHLQESGYYFAEIQNVSDDQLVKYSKAGTDVDIKLTVNPGPIVKLNKIIYLGNDKTRKRVLEKKILMDQGELITPSKTREIESAISATGLFNSVSVQPLRHSSQNTSTDLIVKVVEREYGLVEVAPGYRTDLGLKLTATYSYLNLEGKNMAITARSQVNRRFDLWMLDPTRRDKNKHLIEHNNTLTYSWGDMFDTRVDFTSSASYQRRRFYSFDADIQRYNMIFTRDITRKFSTSARYQFEDIYQFDGTAEKDNGRFRIGAITPSITWDLRNSATIPTEGAFFNMSMEFANPYFFSQKTNDLTINYYKLLSRNRFYIPYKNGTLAISAVVGVQKNLANETVKDQNGNVVNDPDNNNRPLTRGYIPNIKVFRLTGMDIVRGYSDEEINRLPNGNDITEEKISDKAYIANFKIEPRFFINDALMAGVFLDAGRVYRDSMNLGELRSSVGITFKVLTPVGTLDFDYGIKTLRERNKDGSLEDPGRFHVSIGFF